MWGKAWGTPTLFLPHFPTPLSTLLHPHTPHPNTLFHTFPNISPHLPLPTHTPTHFPTPTSTHFSTPPSTLPHTPTHFPTPPPTLHHTSPHPNILSHTSPNTFSHIPHLPSHPNFPHISPIWPSAADQMAKWYGASASGSVDLGFDSESGQTNNLKIGIHSFPA